MMTREYRCETAFIIFFITITRAAGYASHRGVLEMLYDVVKSTAPHERVWCAENIATRT